ncbi:MAG TPA: epoxide hydrolase, partial [Chryseolinea sp.]|nr:epoxide hydrolase [Chryseolinea sp.]
PAIESTETIRPFQIHVPQAELDDLKRRINATRFPETETVNDISQGPPLATVQALAEYWSTSYDWREVEAKINAFPNYTTEIDGLDIHFIHVRSKHKNSLPIIITHGWPGSITHKLKIIDPLTNPTAHGGKVEDAFDVVIPSLPGYGYSGKPTFTGWGPERIARAWVTLMKRLGYEKFLAQGGDWGAIITDVMAAQSPDNLLGIHTNMAGAVPAEVDLAAFSGAPTPSGLSAEEQHAYEQLVFVYKHVFYAYYMGSRPQALAGLADSPVGLATFIIDLERRGLELVSRAFAG